MFSITIRDLFLSYIEINGIRAVVIIHQVNAIFKLKQSSCQGNEICTIYVYLFYITSNNMNA
jgi:hypothetical protein